MSAWKSFRHRLEALAIRALLAFVPRLSRQRCAKLGEALGALAFHFDLAGRRVALANLECAFGDRFTPGQRLEIARRSYRGFGRAMLDLFWARRLTAENYTRYVTLRGFDELRARIEREPRGVVFLTVHQGSWEMGSVASGFHGFRNTTVTATFKNPRLAPIFAKLRATAGTEIIPQENSVLRLLKAVKRGGSTAMLIDLSFRPSKASTHVSAFGLEMSVTALHAILARRAGALLVPVESHQLPDGTSKVIAHPALEFSESATLQEIAQQCWDVFEPILRAQPGEWLWAYKHFRYKPRDATRAYPFYANVSGAFEKMRRGEI